MLKHKLIICSFKNYELVKNKFPKKEVVPDSYCDNKFCYYVRKFPKGVIPISVSDWNIYCFDDSSFYLIPRVRVKKI